VLCSHSSYGWAPLCDDVFFRNRQHAHLGRHHDAIVARDQISRRTQAVAIEGGADLAAVRERDRGRTVPRLHQCGIVFVEGAPLVIHQGIGGPGLRNHHHDRMGQRIAALHQEFERVVEAGRIRLAFVGDRPQPMNVVAIERRSRRRLPRRHPVEIAAQRVDLTVVGDHAVGMGERPGRERVGGKPLVHQRKRTLEIRIAQIRIVAAELVGQEHALVDQGAARNRNRIVAGITPLAHFVEPARDGLAQNVEPPLEFVGVEIAIAFADKDLLVERFGRLHGLTEARIIVRHIAPANKPHSLPRNLFREDGLDFSAPRIFARHEQHADRIIARSGQREAELGCLLGKKPVGKLNQNAGAVAGARIGADGAAMLEVQQNGQRVRNDRVRPASFDVGNETDTARILIEGRVIKTLRGGNDWADIAPFHHSSAPARVMIGSIRPRRRLRDWPVNRRDRAHRLFASSPATFGRPAHLSPLAQSRRCSPKA